MITCNHRLRHVEGCAHTLYWRDLWISYLTARALALHCGGARSAFVHFQAITSGFFGAVQRRVRGVQDQLGRGVSLRSLREADADGDVDPGGARLVRLPR